MRLSVMARRALAALSRFDNASVEDVANALGRNSRIQQRHVWSVLQRIVTEKLAVRTDVAGSRAFYTITEAGRAALIAPATATSVGGR